MQNKIQKPIDSESWDIIIRPREKLLQIDFHELWQYRDLCFLLVKRNLITQYKQTILGPLWYILQPAVSVIMYMVIFGGIAGIPTDGVPQPLFYLAGTCLWLYFSDCLTRTSNTFVSNAYIFGKVYFPRLVMPIADVLSNLLRFAIQFGFFAIVYIIYALSKSSLGAHLTWYVALSPVLIVMSAGLAFGFGTIISSMTTKYRDLRILFNYLVQLWMYATPIVYPLSQAKNKYFLGLSLYKMMCFNPVTPIIETFKYGFLGAGSFIGWGWLAYSFAFVVISLFFGIIFFNKMQKNFMDTV